MQRERDIDGDGTVIRQALRQTSPMAERAAALLGRRGRSRAAPMVPLPLNDGERRHYVSADFALDPNGVECFRGLSRAESLDYIDLQRIGLDNDDDAFLRLIQLGDRHASAMRFAHDR